MPMHSSLVPHACYPGLEGGGEEMYGLQGGAGGGGGTDGYGLGGGAGGGGGTDGYGLGAVPGYNVVFQPGEVGQPTTLEAPISLVALTVGGAVAGAMFTKSWFGALALGIVGYLAGAGLRAATGLKA